MNKKFVGKVLAVIVSLSMIVSITACGKSTSNAAVQTTKETKLDQIKKSGKLVVGTSADYPPYEFHKTINGKDEIVGFDITIANEIAKDLGVKLEIKDMSFDGLLAALQSGNVDIVIAGMNPTEDRKKSVDFSKVYYTSINSVMVRTEDKDKYKTIDDLKGKKIGVQKGTTQEQIAKDQMAGSEIKSLGKVTDLVMQLQNKKVDAIIVELPVATSYASKNKNISVSDVKVKNEEKGSAVAFKKGNEDFVKAVNSTLDKLMKSNSIDKFVTDANNQVE
ncbi:MAG: polar amino acid uptake transporter, family, amino acid-binding protein [Clostridiaceae bacterium]|jgi:polar amino acid transport system substrate-binding protein|nr:polar amino acid uptake transporter, family, amino acid-binding protein [Clostridiaceae bacterium]